MIIEKFKILGTFFFDCYLKMTNTFFFRIYIDDNSVLFYEIFSQEQIFETAISRLKKNSKHKVFERKNKKLKKDIEELIEFLFLKAELSHCHYKKFAKKTFILIKTLKKNNFFLEIYKTLNYNKPNYSIFYYKHINNCYLFKKQTEILRNGCSSILWKEAFTRHVEKTLRKIEL